MGNLILEWCADIFGVTLRSRLVWLLAGCGFLIALGLILTAGWGPLGLVAPAILFLIAALTAYDVMRARDAVWRAACWSLNDAGQRPEAGAEKRLIPPTAVALHQLASLVDHVRRGALIQAYELVPRIDRSRLRQEEAQLLDAARAMISLGLGDAHSAAQQAENALPTGSEDIDLSLGRVMLADAWGVPERLRAIERAWSRAGVAEQPKRGLARLQTLIRIRIDARALTRVQGATARDLSDEARAIGDENLAAELDARARPRAYR